MTQFYRLAMPIIALALAPACNSDRARISNKAADNVVDKQKQLDKELDQQRDRTKDISQKTADLSTATDDFDVKKELRLIGIRSDRAIVAAQPPLLTTMAAQLPLTPQSRSELVDKILILEQDLVDLDAKIADLKTATVSQWKQFNDAATDAMNKAEDAREDAWKTLQNAKRTDRIAS